MIPSQKCFSLEFSLGIPIYIGMINLTSAEE